MTSRPGLARVLLVRCDSKDVDRRPSNKPLQRPGMYALRPTECASAGRSATIRQTNERKGSPRAEACL